MKGNANPVGDSLFRGIALGAYDTVVVVHFFKLMWAYALPDKKTATITSTLFHRWICEDGRWPRQIHTDQGTEFLNSVPDELAKLAGITVTSTKSYIFRENGECKRAIGTLQRILKKKVEFSDCWDSMLPNAVYAYNVTQHVERVCIFCCTVLWHIFHEIWLPRESDQVQHRRG